MPRAGVGAGEDGQTPDGTHGQLDDGGVVNINIVRPSSNAPESKALYDKVRELTADTDSSNEDVLSALLSGLFNIVAELEARGRGED